MTIYNYNIIVSIKTLKKIQIITHKQIKNEEKDNIMTNWHWYHTHRHKYTLKKKTSILMAIVNNLTKQLNFANFCMVS